MDLAQEPSVAILAVFVHGGHAEILDATSATADLAGFTGISSVGRRLPPRGSQGMMPAMEFVVLAVCAAVVAGVVATMMRRRASADADARLAAARADAAAVRKAAQLESQSVQLAAEAEAREQAFEFRAAQEKELSPRLEQLAKREQRLAAREEAAEVEVAAAKTAVDAVRAREGETQSLTDKAKNKQKDITRLEDDSLAALERAAGATAETVRLGMSEAWVEEARAEAAQRIRALDGTTADPEWGRQAKRVMGIAVQRYHAHFLTERLLSNVPIPPGMAEFLMKEDGSLMKALEEGSGVKLELNETGEKIRLDSGDGVAREVVRRALSKLIKGTAPRDAEKDPVKWVQQIGHNLEREIMDLGKRAFAELEIPKAHPEIVSLVGRLNYRTSYTQNQWKHAMEAAYLGGMMAAELGLDVKLMRRATLMHDIGKSLTHQIEGSHAVIGADYARRLGETEIVANAIGSHHADEPPNSVYAYLVAAADAMSGARPGARREQTESHSTKLEDLERIGGSFRGVERAFAVQGGREVRVYVKPDQVSDLRAVELSSEIAARISAEMTFPGQIKVTVIREREAISTAG
jgi:ribonuclease Y